MLSTGFSLDPCDFYRPCRLLVLLRLRGGALFVCCCHQEVNGLQLNNGAASQPALNTNTDRDTRLLPDIPSG
ncbi:hypothetical protein AMECASPLE_039614 [Ameca splendens]|uniref:Uncharacterized protein n=1 Tax=Ameca splendens TaxID=208324 RepID=A0ABV0ZTN5_9TELE